MKFRQESKYRTGISTSTSVGDHIREFYSSLESTTRHMFQSVSNALWVGEGKTNFTEPSHYS